MQLYFLLSKLNGRESNGYEDVLGNVFNDSIFTIFCSFFFHLEYFLNLFPSLKVLNYNLVEYNHPCFSRWWRWCVGKIDFVGISYFNRTNWCRSLQNISLIYVVYTHALRVSYFIAISAFMGLQTCIQYLKYHKTIATVLLRLWSQPLNLCINVFQSIWYS